MKELEKNEIIELSKKLWESPIMQKYTQDEFVFYKLENGEILEFRKPNKIGIDKTIYYSDEYDAPEVTENYFINYNMKNFYSNYHEIHQKYEYTKPYFIQQYSGSRKDVVAVCSYEYVADYDNQLEWAKNNNYFIRFLTTEEIEEYKKIIEDIKEKYVERLKKYYKRYNNKISTYGYWADR